MLWTQQPVNAALTVSALMKQCGVQENSTDLFKSGGKTGLFLSLVGLGGEEQRVIGKETFKKVDTPRCPSFQTVFIFGAHLGS